MGRLVSHARRLRRAARKDVLDHAPDAKDPEARFAKRIAAALSELGASGADPDAATLQLLCFAAEFAAFSGIPAKDFLEQAELEYADAVIRFAAAAGGPTKEGP